MRLIAMKGEPDERRGRGYRVLIETRQDYGFVHVLGTDTRYEDFFIHSILARGYWREPTISLSDEEMERIAKLPIVFE
jgi:hypothetical protein